MDAGRREPRSLLRLESQRMEWFFLRMGDRKDLGPCFLLVLATPNFFISLVLVRDGRRRVRVLSRAGVLNLPSRFCDGGILSHRDTQRAAWPLSKEHEVTLLQKLELLSDRYVVGRWPGKERRLLSSTTITGWSFSRRELDIMPLKKRSRGTRCLPLILLLVVGCFAITSC